MVCPRFLILPEIAIAPELAAMKSVLIAAPVFALYSPMPSPAKRV
jgi:hypothetical protein